ncbi:MAG: MBL fold metallo-hydrolase [Gemmatimonadota bacterium]|nr:MBL fold metallo-hydrolase [Gemmatimonadota bacterium]MDH5804989.1 MBL fold metallo-hydrolase [Gemmatimonadota bacterium]
MTFGNSTNESLSALSRRAFVAAGASCAAHLLFVDSLAGFSWNRSDRSLGRTVREEPWGYLTEVADRMWALVSTPLQDRTTLCNGGIIAGTDGVLMVEGFASAEGASWMASMAVELTGRAPTHVVVSHFHGDHANGLHGYVRDGALTPRIYATQTTRDLILETDNASASAPLSVRSEFLEGAILLDGTRPTRIDLGGRSVDVHGREGHTPSDVTVEVEEPSVVWCGDLVWNNMFPNYRDAVPSRLSRSVRSLKRGNDTVYVPGHGVLASNLDLDRYVQVIDLVETAALSADEAGIDAAEAAAGFTLPQELGEWMLFNPRYYEVALTAWERELRGG